MEMMSVNVGAVIFVALFILSVAAIGGGFVLYRQSVRTGWRAIGMSAIAGGVAALLFLTLSFPLIRSGGPSEPVISTGPAATSTP